MPSSREPDDTSPGDDPYRNFQAQSAFFDPMTIRGVTVALAVAFALMVAAPASAYDLASPPRSDLAMGPNLVGGQVAWADETCVTGCDPADEECNATYRYTLRQATPGERPRTVLSRLRSCASNGGPAYDIAGVDVALSPRYIAIQSSRSYADETTGDEASVSLRAGPRMGPRQTLYSCADGLTPFKEDEYANGGARFGLSGSTLAWEQACPGRAQIFIRDLATGHTSELKPQGSRIESLVLAGHWLAVSTDTAVERYDAATGTLQTRFANPDPKSSVNALRVAPDGTITFMARSDCRAPAMSASVGDTTAHTLPIRTCGPVFVSPDGFVYPPIGKSRGLRLLPSRGADRPVLSVPAALLKGGFDVEGSKAVYASARCDGGVGFRVVSLARHTTVRDHPCPVRDARRAAANPRDGRMTVRLRCPLGCLGTIRVRFRGKVTSSPYFQLAPSPAPQLVRLLLGKRARGALRHGYDPGRLRVAALTTDLRDRRHTTTLRPPRAVRRLPGGRSSDAVVFDDLRVEQAGRRRALRLCFSVGNTVDEKSGLPMDIFSYDSEVDRCVRKTRIRAGRPFTVRTPRELVRLRAAVGDGTEIACRRHNAVRWRCHPSVRGAGRRPRVTLRAAYRRGASATWLAGLAN